MKIASAKSNTLSVHFLARMRLLLRKMEVQMEQTTSWRAVLTEHKGATNLVRTLVLTPGVLTVDGFEESGGDPITLQQSSPLTKS